MSAWVKSINHLYQSEKALHECCTKPEGFKWVRVDDWQQSVLAYERIGIDPDDRILTILNMTPVDRPQYRIGLEENNGSWKLIDHSDKNEYWGQAREVRDLVKIEKHAWEHKDWSMEFALPGLTVLIYKWVQGKRKEKVEVLSASTSMSKKKNQSIKKLPEPKKAEPKKAMTKKAVVKKSVTKKSVTKKAEPKKAVAKKSANKTPANAPKQVKTTKKKIKPIKKAAKTVKKSVPPKSPKPKAKIVKGKKK
jgi:1,4-alpha-glucan branching enzyme